MTAPPALPILPGLTWSRHKKPAFSTRVASHVSGREVRVALMSYPLYEFEATYSGLASSATAAFSGLGSSSLQNLMGFFLQLLGQAGTFLYTDPDDNTVAAQFIATGDGATLSFLVGRTFGGFNEPMTWITSIANVYLNGVVQAANSWVFTAPNSIGFYTPPGAGVAITADISYAFQCRFLDDQMDFEEFMSSLWRLDSMKFRSIKANTTPAAPPIWYMQYQIAGTNPTLFADTSTEGASNHYLYNGTTYGSFAALLTALGISFSRASSAYYTNSSGVLTLAASGALRFDYRGGVAVGILQEGASTNYLVPSNSFSTGGSPWNLDGTTISTSGRAPDGIASATLITASAGTGFHDLNLTAGSGGFSIPVGARTFSAYLKAGTVSYGMLQITQGGSESNRYAAIFSLSGAGSVTQTISLGSPSGVNSGIQYVGGGYYLCSITLSEPTNTTFGLAFGLVNAASVGGSTGYGRPEWTAVGTETVYMAFCNVENLSFASSYIPTTTSTATRPADSFSAATWSAVTSATLFVKGDTAYGGKLQKILQIDGGSNSNLAALSFNASAAVEFDLVNGGSSEAALTAGTISANTSVQTAAAFQVNDFALVENGGTPAIAASGAIPSFANLRIGADASGANYLFGHIAQLGVWNNLRGPNASLQILT